MSSRLPRFYRFATSDQWKACLLHRLEAGKHGPVPIPRLVGPATPLALGGGFSRVAVDPWGGAWWRRDPSDGEPGGLMRSDDGITCGPYEIESVLAGSPRWQADRRGVWGFNPKRPIVRRYHRDSLRGDLEIDLHQAEGPGGPGVGGRLAIVDMTRDGREGVWLLVRSGVDDFTLRHLDCEGHLRAVRPVPCEVGPPQELGSVGGRQLELVVLTEGGRRLALLDGGTGAVTRVVMLEGLGPCWSARRMATDTRNRIALWGGGPGGTLETGPRGQAGLALLDGAGDSLDGPVVGLLPGGSASPGPEEESAAEELVDLAVDGDGVWFATPRGGWLLQSRTDAGGPASAGTLLTPRLESPERDSARGWLRAELTLDLPRGAVLEAEFATTNDQRVADSLDQLARDTSLVAERRLQGVWNTLERRSGRSFRVEGPQTHRSPVTIPLFDSKDRWLWLRLDLLVPPGDTGVRLEQLRVLYPEVSIARHLPAIFFEKEDPGGFLRRFVGVLESTTQDLDERIRAIGSWVNPETAPDEWLDYLAQWLELPWEDALPVPVKRRLLQRAGELIDQRATLSGLAVLLECLLGKTGRATIRDVTVDYPPVRLGGPRATLPALLAGVSVRAATLGGKAVVGRACLGRNDDPLADIVPTVRVEVAAPRPAEVELGLLVERVVRQYLPAGVRLALKWRPNSEGVLGAGGRLPLELATHGPGELGTDTTIGRTRVGGTAMFRLDECGREVGSRLG